MSPKKEAKSSNDFDVLNFETKHVAEEGVFMPFKHPKTGEELTHQTDDDKDPRALGLLLKGIDSADAQRFIRQAKARETRRGQNYTPSDADIEADRISDSKGLARLTLGGLLFSGGKWVEMTSGNASDYLYSVDPLRKQAIAFVLDEGNHLAA